MIDILVADDDPVSRLLVNEALNQEGYQIHEVTGGRQVLEVLGRHPDIQILVLDWSMPELNGLELCQQLKGFGDRFFYIIMLTGRSGTEHMVEAIDAGADDFIAKPFAPEELKARVRVGGRIVVQERRLAFYANHDSLTGVWNRRYVMQMLKREWNRFQRGEGQLFTLMLDIDYFKRINDEHGHLTGDKVLQAFVEVVRQQLRPYDGLGRYGGEEFLLVLPDCSEDKALVVAERIRAALYSTPLSVDLPSPLSVTVSIGMSQCRKSDEGPEGVLARADEALYQAKEGGRNRVEFKG